MRTPTLITAGAFVLVVSLSAPAAAAQDVAASTAVASRFNAAAMKRALGPLSTVRFDRMQAQPDEDMKDRACPGCPKRRLAIPFLDTLWLNVMYNGINHLSDDATANVGPKSWWANMKAGFEWDNNPWQVNQIGHPYQGSNYFTAGRANGLGFYESAAVAAFGSGTWEFYAENNKASFNDLINTTLGGIAIGEVLHRVGWLVRDPRSESRSKKEWVAMAIDPLNGLHRMISGDAKRVTDKPPSMIPSSVRFDLAGGVLWQGENLHEAQTSATPFVDMNMRYGEPRTGRSRIPYEAFAVAFSVGGGSGVSQAGIRGRLYGRPFKEDSRYQFSVFQTFDFIQNDAYDFGGQGVEIEAGTTRQLSERTSIWLAGTLGVNILGAVNSLIPPPENAILLSGGGADGSRQYDYGPGGRWGAVAQLSRADVVRATMLYQAYHVSVVDGTRSNHILQRLYLDLRQPVSRILAIGAAGEFFFRKAYFWAAGDRTDSSPQFRLFVVWSPR